MEPEKSFVDKRITFLPQIRLGDLVTVGTLIIAGAGWYFKTDARIARVDEIIVEIKAEAKQQRADMKENVGELRTEIKETRAAVESVSRKIDRRGNGQ